MHKRTAKLAEYFEGWLGPVLFYGVWPEEAPINDETPIMFSDDPKWKPEDWESLGPL